MIFSGNTTALGATTIPMAEGYDCSYGPSLMLVESARNDLAMFKALIQADYKEMSICRESAGVVQEGDILALQEAVGGGIFKKIAELFKKLIAKIKAIFHNFLARFRSLYMKDKDLVKKYEKELIRKQNINKLEVKWRAGNDITSDAWTFEELDEMFKEDEGWNEDSSERDKFYMEKFTENPVVKEDSIDEYIKEIINTTLEDEEVLELGDSKIGGIRTIMRFLSEYDSRAKKMDTAVRKVESNLQKVVNKYDKNVKNTITDVKNTGDNTPEAKEDNDKKLEKINHTYDMALSYQRVVSATMSSIVQINTIMYKQAKAAFMKAITVNPKKLEESMVYAEAVAAVAENEVEDVINGALSKEELSDLCSASKNVMDGGVSDDPDKLTYGPDKYTDDASFSGSQGSIDSRIGGGKVEEAYFGKLFY